MLAPTGALESYPILIYVIISRLHILFLYVVFKTSGKEVWKLLESISFLFRMKKVLLAILTFSYLIACIGFTVQKPYCPNMNANVSLSNCISKKCDKCNNENIKKQGNRCCSNESRFVKNDNDQVTPESVFHPAQATHIAIHTSFFEMSFNAPASIAGTSLINHRQPPDGTTAIYVRNCVFRI